MKTCFVISPIGEEGSDIRQYADDLLELVISPALSKFSFNIVRADKIASPSSITNDIIEQVQNAELCIADLSGHNPNVFYECGRRHENGRPLIQLLRKGEKLPFDLAGIRTIFYDLSTPRSVREVADSVEEFVDDLLARRDFDSNVSAVSLSSLGIAIARIERKLSSMQGSIGHTPLQQLTPDAPKRSELLSMHPSEAFHKAFAVGDIEGAKFVLPRVQKFLGDIEYAAALGLLAKTADDESATTLRQMLIPAMNDNQQKVVEMIALALRDYYINTNSLEAGAKALDEIVTEIRRHSNHTPEVLATALNARQGIVYQSINDDDISQLQAALDAAEEAVALIPSNPSYVYNLSMIQEKGGDLDAAMASLRKWAKLAKDVDESSASHVMDVFSAAGQAEEGQQLIASAMQN